MSYLTGVNGPPERSPELLWHIVQQKKIDAFNEANKAKTLKFKCWPVLPRGGDDQYCHWLVVVINDVHAIPDAESACQISIGDQDCQWEATRVPNPLDSSTIQVEGHGLCTFQTYRVKVPRTFNNGTQPSFTPLEMTRAANGGPLTPVLSADRMLLANLRLSAKSTPQLDGQIRTRAVPKASWQFHDPKHYLDIHRWGTEQEFEFEAAAIRDFNLKSVYQCWLVLCHPSEDELRQSDSSDITQQQCVVIVASPKLHESFPKVGDLCDLAFAVEIPELENKDAHITKDNLKLKRRGVRYFKGIRLDNPREQFNLDDRSRHGRYWSNYSCFKLSVYRDSPFQDFVCLLDSTMISSHDGGRKPQVLLDASSSFQAHVWLDISDTTMRVELNALKTAMEQPSESPVGQAFSYIRTFETSTRNFQPHMQDPDNPKSQLSDNQKAAFRGLDDDQKRAFSNLLAGLQCRVGIVPGGPGSGKTELILRICALALSNRGKPKFPGGPVLLILEANRPANNAATRVVQYFQRLGRTDLRIVRAYNFNYEGKWGTRRYLKVDENDEATPAFDFDECFPTHRADHIPQLRRGDRGDCIALTLREFARLYLAQHPEDFPLLWTLLTSDDVDFDDHHDEGLYQEEWNALFVAVLAEIDFLITTTVGAAKIAQYFRPKLVIFDDAACARELSTLVAIAKFPSAEAWLFFGTPEMKKPYVSSHGNPDLWNPCADQLRTSMMERYLACQPDTHRLLLNHQAYGDLHFLSSDLFWGGQIESALPSSDRFPPSTTHLLDYCRNLAANPTLTIPRLLVHVKSIPTAETKQKSKYNLKHLNWVISVVRNLVQDQDFRTTDSKEPGSILITTPYSAQASNYRKAINGLMKDMDRQHRLAGGHGEGLHREVLVEARTADTVQCHAADLVIFDTVHSEVTSHTADPNRLCAALTRAKQAEIIVMEKSMLRREGPAHTRRRHGFGDSHIDLLYEHCKSKGQVIEVDLKEDSPVEKDYILHRAEAGPARDASAVPRQLPAAPSGPDLTQDNEQVDTPRGVAASDSQGPRGNDDDDGYVGSMFESDERFGFEMVRKAMKLGLNLSVDTNKGE